MLELLFLLLPVAAAYGWYMGRRSAQQTKQDEANRLSRDYVAGVNFLLSNQQDKAVDLFLDMLKEDTGTVEAHLTLGNLFRSRGEVDRAIRIHQTLMESASLTYEQRLLAVQQLGRDYMAAGLYDRAEDMFSQLVDVSVRFSSFCKSTRPPATGKKRLIPPNGWSNSVKTNNASKLPTSIASWLSSRWVAMTWIKPWHC